MNGLDVRASRQAARIPRRWRWQGFTLVELIVVLLMTGIIAAIAVPRFVERNSFDSYGFHQQTLEMLRFAQKSAIAKRRNVCVNVGAASISLTFASAAGSAAACNSNLLNPADGSPYSRSVPAGVSISPAASFTYSALGRSSNATTVNLTINADVTRNIYIEPETGYVH